MQKNDNEQAARNGGEGERVDDDDETERQQKRSLGPAFMDKGRLPVLGK